MLQGRWREKKRRTTEYGRGWHTKGAVSLMMEWSGRETKGEVGNVMERFKTMPRWGHEITSKQKEQER